MENKPLHKKQISIRYYIDDRREAGYGVYYTQKKPLNAAALVWRENKKKPGI